MLILDVGAKYGIHPAFKKLENIYNFHLVDADKSEVSYLKKNYRKQKNIKCFNYFFDNLGVEKFKNINLYDHIGKHSFYELLDGKIKGKAIVPTSSIDKIKEKITFLKIDVEGKEIDCLKGGLSQLKKNILGVRCEVLLNPLYKGQSETWSKVNNILRGVGFEFMNFDIIKNVTLKSFLNFHIDNSSGQFYAVDGIWVKNVKFILKSKDYKEIINYAVFCILNNLKDLAIFVLSKKMKLIHRKLKSDLMFRKIFFFIEYELANSFFNLKKELIYEKNIEKIFFSIFKKKMPIEGEFFKRYPLNYKL
jgi:FkbM family methyltransferase